MRTAVEINTEFTSLCQLLGELAFKEDEINSQKTNIKARVRDLNKEMLDLRAEEKKAEELQAKEKLAKEVVASLSKDSKKRRNKK